MFVFGIDNFIHHCSHFLLLTSTSHWEFYWLCFRQVQMLFRDRCLPTTNYVNAVFMMNGECLCNLQTCHHRLAVDKVCIVWAKCIVINFYGNSDWNYIGLSFGVNKKGIFILLSYIIRAHMRQIQIEKEPRNWLLYFTLVTW